MATFPPLQTGAVTQYPASYTSTQPVSIVRFLDSTDQRWMTQGAPLRSWQINLALVSEAELFSIESFFESQDGQYTTFTFTDPFTGQAVANCRFGDASITTEYDAPNSGRTSFWVIETNG